MPNRPNTGRRLDVVIVLGLLGVFLFTSPLVDWWSRDGRPWYTPYLLWLLVIGVGIWVDRVRGRIGGDE